MTNAQRKKEEPPLDEAAEESAADSAEESDGEAAAAPDDNRNGLADAEPIDLGPPVEDEAIATLEAEKAELRDQVLRTLAEMENVRRRAQRDKEDAAKFGVTAFARDMLGVADNLRRALDAIQKDRLSQDHELKNLYEGVELVERELLQAFERHGIERVAPIGEKFDHNFHQAMFEVEDADAAPGTVVQLMAPGYVLHGRLLRPALVGVAKAPSQPGAGQQAAAQDGPQSEGNGDAKTTPPGD